MHDIEKLLNALEGVLYVANRPIPAQEILEFFKLEEELLKELMSTLQARYENTGLMLKEIAGGYELVTQPDYAKFIEEFFTVKEKRKLSVAALETLSIIAWRQPVTRFEIEEVRGVSSDAVVNRLLELNLVKIVGRRETVGKPYEYGTTTEFLHYFGLKDLTDLPPMDAGLTGLLDQGIERAAERAMQGLSPSKAEEPPEVKEEIPTAEVEAQVEEPEAEVSASAEAPDEAEESPENSPPATEEEA